MFILNGGAVTWRSSTTESEYIAINEAAKEAMWMRKFIGDLGIVPSINDPVNIFCDNESAVVLAQEPRSQKRTRHILRKYHYVRQVVADKDIVISQINTSDNLADPFTKPLAQAKHESHSKCIGIHALNDLV